MVWRSVSQWWMASEREKAASSRCGERIRIFSEGSVEGYFAGM
jgi:hypothetical protein